MPSKIKLACPVNRTFSNYILVCPYKISEMPPHQQVRCICGKQWNRGWRWMPTGLNTAQVEVSQERCIPFCKYVYLSYWSLLSFLFLSLSESFSGNNDHFLAVHRQKGGKPVFVYQHTQDVEKSLEIVPQKIYKHSYHSSSVDQIRKRHQIVNSAFPRPAYDPSLNLLAMSGQDPEVENLPIPAANVIVVVSSTVFDWYWGSVPFVWERGQLVITVLLILVFPSVV